MACFPIEARDNWDVAKCEKEMTQSEDIYMNI